MDGKKFGHFLLFFLFFKNFYLFSEHETVKLTNISEVSQPIIFLAKIFVEHHKKGKLKMPLISIAGCMSVGKTEFAKGLALELEKVGIRAEILKQDDFIIPCRINNSGHGTHPWLNHKEMHRVINDIKNGKLHITKPKYDWKMQMLRRAQSLPKEKM